MIKIIGVGDNTVDTYVHLKQRFPGGNALNVAVLAKRYGAEAAYLGCVGNDDRGRLILEALKKEGVDISHCRVIEGVPTAYSEVMVIDGERVFGNSEHGASTLLMLTEEDLAYISTFDLVHTSIYSNLESQLEKIRGHVRYISFDLSQHLTEDYWYQVLPFVDIAFISLSMVPLANLERYLYKLSSFGPTWVIATRGAQGAWLYDGHSIYYQPTVPVKVIDTLGAGDAFAARFLVDFLAGKPLNLAMENAAQAAAENCTHYGAFGYGQPYDILHT
ncbi:MAG: PfkB family carbohydrate kinase [Thermanaerothrix sp.]|uniref:PfkB family carbohydrate kinase n=1 Tax=Thermanaerothrix sp. TaxID=2972675 RepID=UPI003C798318